MKSIYGRLKQTTNFNIQPAPILQYGYENSRILREPSNMVPLVRSKHFQVLVEVLKLTAAKYNLNSLSMSQINSLLKCFCIHRKLENTWFNTTSSTLNPEDYEIFVNPMITASSEVLYYEYEYCSSFQCLKVKTKRPTSIKVNYLNQQGEEKEQILQGFPARVFCHEYEHLLGIPFIDWKVSLGEIEVIEGFENSYENLIQTVEFYKKKIRENRVSNKDVFEVLDRNSYMSQDHKGNENMTSNWVNYTHQNYDKLNEFDFSMLVDIEISIRKDLKKVCKKNNNIEELKRLMEIDGEFQQIKRL